MDNNAFRRIGLAVIAQAVRDVNVAAVSLQDREIAVGFLREGAPGWAEIAGLNGAVIRKHADLVIQGDPRILNLLTKREDDEPKIPA